MDPSALVTGLDSHEKSWSSLDAWLNFWTLLVVIGVSLEILIIAVEFAREYSDFKRDVIHTPEMPSILAFALGMPGAGLVAIGVAGEFRIHIIAGKIETDMRDATRQLVAFAERDAAKANKNAGDAKERAGEAYKQASRNEREAARLTKENLLLQEKIAPRRLDKGARDRVSAAARAQPVSSPASKPARGIKHTADHAPMDPKGAAPTRNC